MSYLCDVLVCFVHKGEHVYGNASRVANPFFQIKIISIQGRKNKNKNKNFMWNITLVIHMYNRTSHSMVILCKIKLIFQVCVDADYRLEIRVFSYNNPTHRCARCGPQQPCCDGNRTELCSGPEQCDNYFVFCLRPLGTSGFNNQYCPLGRYSTALNSILNDQDSFVFEEGE